MRAAIPVAVLLLAALMGAEVGRTGAGKLKAQETQCTTGTPYACREVATCERRGWVWIQMSTGLFFPARLCVEWSREYNYWQNSLGSSSGSSDDAPPGDLPGSDEGA